LRGTRMGFCWVLRGCCYYAGR